jgi:hypothetical protein
VTSGSAGSAEPAEGVCQAPPNTPAVTRPPSVSPQPCSSRDLSRSGFSDPPEDTRDACDDDDDDVTLEDLVAMETMDDDICDDEQFFQVRSIFFNTIFFQQKNLSSEFSTQFQKWQKWFSLTRDALFRLGHNNHLMQVLILEASKNSSLFRFDNKKLFLS